MDNTREQRATARGHGDDLTTTVSRLPTPTARLGTARGTSHPDRRKLLDKKRAGELDEIAEHVLLPTPTPTNRDGNTVNNRGELLLPGVAESLLPTPTAKDEAAGGGSNPSNVTLTDAVVRTEFGAVENPRHMLPTPLGSDGEKGGPNQRGGAGDLRISSVDLLFPTPSVAIAEGGQTSRSGDRADEPLLGGIVDGMVVLPTPTTEPNTGNGHARDLGGEVALLPTPAAGTPNDGEDAAQWQAWHDRHAGKTEGATRSGLPLAIAVQQAAEEAEHVDETADGTPVKWGKYRAAILRAQVTVGRLAPPPTLNDGKGGKRRLAARFVEWMMMLSDGWVTGVPGLTRRAMLKMLGNGVVPAQASAASVILLARVREALAERQGTP